MTSYVISRNIDDRFTNFGASGAIVFGLLMWVVLALVFRGSRPKARSTQSRTVNKVERTTLAVLLVKAMPV